MNPLAVDLDTAASVSSLSRTHLQRAINKGELRVKRSSQNKDGDPQGKRVILMSDLQAYLEALPDG